MDFTTELLATGGTTTVRGARRGGATSAWAGLSYSQQRQHAEAVLAAKKPETRERRVSTIVGSLAGAG